MTGFDVVFGGLCLALAVAIMMWTAYEWGRAIERRRWLDHPLSRDGWR